MQNGDKEKLPRQRNRSRRNVQIEQCKPTGRVGVKLCVCVCERVRGPARAKRVHKANANKANFYFKSTCFFRSCSPFAVLSLPCGWPGHWLEGVAAVGGGHGLLLQFTIFITQFLRVKLKINYIHDSHNNNATAKANSEQKKSFDFFDDFLFHCSLLLLLLLLADVVVIIIVVRNNSIKWRHTQRSDAERCGMAFGF